jgi:8-oxo-dGTP pyrophosphatase MutT (NUDIX family)
MDSLFLDLCVRFIINLPNEEIVDEMRVMYQVEEMYYYFLDNFPSLKIKYNLSEGKDKGLRFFIDQCKVCFQTHLKISPYEFESIWNQYLFWKKEIPIAGAIIFKKDFKEIEFLSVKGTESQKWGAPKGKLNYGESWLQAAQREVWEETGWNGWNLMSFTDEEWIQPSSSSLKKFSSNINYYVDLHFFDSPNYKPYTPIRFYVLNYNWIIKNLHEKNKNATFSNLDKKEISEIAWVKWSDINKKKDQFIYLIRKYYSQLTFAIEFVLKQEKLILKDGFKK